MKSLFSFVGTLVLITLFGCTQDISIVEPDTPSQSTCQYTFNNNEGVLHNDMVIEIYDIIDSCYSSTSFLDNYGAIITSKMSTFTSLLNITEAELVELLDSIDIDGIKSIVNGSTTLNDYISNSPYISSNLSSYIIPLLNYVDGYNFVNNHVLTFENDLCFLIQNQSPILDSTDQYLYDLFVDVLVNSNKLWMDTNLGGQGYFTNYQNLINSYCTYPQPRWINWGKVFLTDAATAIIGCTTAIAATGGAAAIPVEGGIPPAGIYGIGAGVSGSISSVIGQL